MSADNIDLDAALARLGGNRTLLTSIIQFYLEDAPELLDHLRQALAQRDSKLVERSAHSLKGLSSSFDANRVVAAAKDMETFGRTGDLSSAQAAFDSFESEVNGLVEALRAEQHAARATTA